MSRLSLSLVIVLVVLLVPSCTGAKASELPQRETPVTRTLERHERGLDSNRELLKTISKKVDSLSSALQKHIEEE